MSSPLSPPSSLSPFMQLLKSAKIIVCMGSGGVGKTTTSSAIAYAAASSGRKVLALTIDPSQRLKSTLGLKEGQNRVEIEFAGEGSLAVELIDHKQTFDEFVLKATNNLTGSDSAAKRIFENKLYKELSTSLVGSQEFTALEKLLSSYKCGHYDLIVLDTPPTEHALNFLESPQKFKALFSESVLKWFRDPKGSEQNIFVRFMSAGTKQALNALEILTGSQFIAELKDFFQAIYLWQDRLEQRAGEVQNLLRSEACKFLLVTNLDVPRLREAQHLISELQALQTRINGTIVNRAIPEWMLHADLSVKYTGLEEQVRAYFLSRQRLAEDLDKNGFIVKVPEFKDNVSDLEDVKKLAEFLRKL